MKKPTTKKKLATKKTPAKKVAAKKSAVKKTTKKIVAKKSPAKKVIKKVTKTVTTVTTTQVSPKETHYVLVLDESSSMGSVRNETLIGVNEQLKTIKKLAKQYKDQKYFVSIVKFSTYAKHLIENVSASSVNELADSDYNPNGYTALHDAIGLGINSLKNKIGKKLDSGEASALVVILTDGEENKSKEFNADSIKNLITSLEKTGMWTFTFIGANQDAVLTASSLGVNINNTVNYSASNVGTTLAFASISSAMGKREMYRSAGAYEATTDNFLSEVTSFSNDIGEDASLLDLSGTVSAADIKKAKDSISKKIKNNGNTN